MADWKTLYGRRFGEPIKGPIIPFGTVAEHHPISMRDQSRLHQFGKKVPSGIFPGYPLFAEEIWKGDIQIAAELKKLDASEICPRRVNVKEVLISSKRRRVQILRNSRWYSKIVTRRLRIPRTHSKAETHRMERRFQWRTSTRIGRVSTDSTDR